MEQRKKEQELQRIREQNKEEYAEAKKKQGELYKESNKRSIQEEASMYETAKDDDDIEDLESIVEDIQAEDFGDEEMEKLKEEIKEIDD